MQHLYFSTTEVSLIGETLTNIFKIEREEGEFDAETLSFVQDMQKYIFVQSDHPAKLLFEYMNNNALISTMLADIDLVEFIEAKFTNDFPEVTLTKLN